MDTHSNMSWDIVIGQNRAKRIIQKHLEQNRLPHSLLLYGGDGVGKDAAAIQIAKILNCKTAVTDSCDSCPDCHKVNILQHPNVHLVFPLPVGKNELSDDLPLDKLTPEDLSQVYSELAAKAKNPYHKISIERANFIKITSIREIRKKSALSVLSQGRKVIIIFDAEKMNEQSSNALLKTLEEPLGETVLILTTSNKDALLPTIISRCQLIRFEDLKEDEISAALQSRENLDEQQSKIISRLSNGSYTHALQLMQTDLNAKRNQLVDFLAIILTQNTLKISEEIEKMTKENDRAEIEQLLLLLQVWFRDVHTLSIGSDQVLNVDQKTRLEKFNAIYKNFDIYAVFKEIEKALLLLKKNVYIQLIITVMVIKIRRIILVKN